MSITECETDYLYNGSTGRVTAGSFGTAAHFRSKSARCNTQVIQALGVMELLPLDDSRWSEYRDAYRRAPCDAVEWIRELQDKGTSDEYWKKIWNELHHQGDVGEASYAIVPYFVEYQSNQKYVDEQLFHFAVVVDLAQSEDHNPPIPKELEFSYAVSMRRLPVLGAERLRRGDSTAAVMGVVASIALEAGQKILAHAYLDFGCAEAKKFMYEYDGFIPNEDDT